MVPRHIDAKLGQHEVLKWLPNSYQKISANLEWKKNHSQTFLLRWDLHCMCMKNGKAVLKAIKREKHAWKHYMLGYCKKNLGKDLIASVQLCSNISFWTIHIHLLWMMKPFIFWAGLPLLPLQASALFMTKDTQLSILPKVLFAMASKSSNIFHVWYL